METYWPELLTGEAVFQLYGLLRYVHNTNTWLNEGLIVLPPPWTLICWIYASPTLLLIVFKLKWNWIYFPNFLMLFLFLIWVIFWVNIFSTSKNSEGFRIFSHFFSDFFVNGVYGSASIVSGSKNWIRWSSKSESWVLVSTKLAGAEKYTFVSNMSFSIGIQIRIYLANWVGYRGDFEHKKNNFFSPP